MQTQHCWLTAPNIVGRYLLRPFAHHVACCRLGVVAQSLQPVKLLSQQLPTFLFFPWTSQLGSVCTALPTLLGPRTGITHGLPSKVLWVVSFPRLCTVGLNVVGSCFVRLLVAYFTGKKDFHKRPKTAVIWTWINCNVHEDDLKFLLLRNGLLIFNELTSAVQ